MEITRILELSGKGFNTEQIKALDGYKSEDITALLDGGKSVDDVMSLLPIMDKATTVNVDNPTDKPVDNPTDKPVDNQPTTTDALMQEIKNLKATIQAQNLKNASINDDHLKKPTADSVISSFFDKPDKTK